MGNYLYTLMNIIRSNYKLPPSLKDERRPIICTIVLLLILVACIAIEVACSYQANILDPDDITPWTGQFYVNTIGRSLDEIKFNVRLM
jgi:hypothetical protein